MQTFACVRVFVHVFACLWCVCVCVCSSSSTAGTAAMRVGSRLSRYDSTPGSDYIHKYIQIHAYMHTCSGILSCGGGEGGEEGEEKKGKEKTERERE